MFMRKLLFALLFCPLSMTVFAQTQTENAAPEGLNINLNYDLAELNGKSLRAIERDIDREVRKQLATVKDKDLKRALKKEKRALKKGSRKLKRQVRSFKKSIKL